MASPVSGRPRRRLRRRIVLSVLLLSIVTCVVTLASFNSPESRSDLSFERGFYRWRTGDLAAAVDEFTQAIEANPNNGAAYLQRARTYADLGRYGEALADYEHVLALYPDTFMAYADRAEVYAEQGNYRAAAADYSRVIALKPYYADAYYRRGLVLEALGDLAAAQTDYARFLSLYDAEDARAADARARLSALGKTPSPGN